MSEEDDYSSETDDSYDEDYDEDYDETPTEDTLPSGEWDSFFANYRKNSNTPSESFEPTKPLLTEDKEKEPPLNLDEVNNENKKNEEDKPTTNDETKAVQVKDNVTSTTHEIKEDIHTNIKEEETAEPTEPKDSASVPVEIVDKIQIPENNQQTNTKIQLPVESVEEEPTKELVEEEKQEVPVEPEKNQKEEPEEAEVKAVAQEKPKEVQEKAKESPKEAQESPKDVKKEETKEEKIEEEETLEQAVAPELIAAMGGTKGEKKESFGPIQEEPMKEPDADTLEVKKDRRGKRRSLLLPGKSKKDEDKKRKPKKRRSANLTQNPALATPEEIQPSSAGLGRETIHSHSALTASNEDPKKKSLLKRLKMKKEKGHKQDQKKAATKIQSVWRGYIFRKRLAETGPTSVSLKQLYSLQNIAEVETKYVSNLSTIIEHYLRPLIEFNKFNEEARKALPIQVVKAIFRNIETIYNIHVEFLKGLKNRIDAWPFVTDIPAMFLKVTASFSVYSSFAEDAAAAEETLRFYKQNPPLSTFLVKMYDERMKQAHCGPNTRLPGLYALLVLPFKHLGKLSSVFSAFMCDTPSSYPDYELLADSVAILGQLKNFIWQTADAGISKRKMILLEKKIQSANDNTRSTVSKPRVIKLNPNQPLKAENLIQKPKKKRKSGKKSSSSSTSKKRKHKKSSEVESAKPLRFELHGVPGRKLVRNGNLLVGAQKRQVFLFNDVCLILEVIAADRSRFEAVFDLQNSEVHSKSVSLQENTQTFRVKCTSGDFIFTEKLTSDDDEASWMNTFEELITLSNDKIFGTSLATVLERENSAIPSVILNIVQHLSRNITDPELFQSSVNYNTVQSLRDPSAHRKLNNSKISDVVGLLVLYLEQLPDILIHYHEKDPIFTAQSTPDQETLLEWVRKQLNEMPLCSRNLLEYLMSFLSKVLARSALNGVDSIDLAVIFSPLVVRPEKLTLGYCFRMARVVRLVRIMIERAGDLFKTMDNESYPLPESLEEFFGADQFGQWWRDFRQKKNYFIQYIAKPEMIQQLVSKIMEIPNSEETAEQKRAAQFASLAYGVMVNDGVISAMFENDELLSVVVKEFKGQRVNERANKHFCDFIEVLLRGNPELMTKFLEQNPEMNKNIVASIGSGNFCNMILSVAETWQMSNFVHRIVVGWGVVALYQYLESQDTHDSDQLANTVRFLRFLVRTGNFVNSPTCAEFANLLNNEDYIAKMIDKSISSDPDTCVCTIPLVIEILVQNKNRTPGKSPLDNIILQPPDSSKLSAEERQDYIEKSAEAYRLLKEQLREDVPSIILILLERHEDLVKHMRSALDKSPAEEPLGFFRFGIVKLVQALLVTNYPYTNSFMATTDLVAACLELFFHYYRHSILHSVIAYIIRYIMAMGNRDLVEMVLLRLDLPGQIIKMFDTKTEEDSVRLDNLRGYLKMLSVAIRNSSIAEALLEDNSQWHSYVSDILLREEEKPETDESTTQEVVLAQKKIARSNLTKKDFTDQMEDKLG